MTTSGFTYPDTMLFLPRLFAALLLCMATLVTCPGAFANDTSIGDDNGTITFKYQPEISMDKEALFVSEEKVQVDYIFTNSGPRDVTIPVAFPMPPVYFDGGSHNEMEDFKLWVNGMPQQTTIKWVVLRDGVDISGEISKLGWSVNDTTSFVRWQVAPKDKKSPPKEWLRQDVVHEFTMSRYYIWNLNFPAGKPVSVRHTYRPSVTTGVPWSSGDILESYAEKNCIGKSTAFDVKKRDSQHGIHWANLRYILTTANNWQGPIKDFSLTIKKKNASDLVSLCFDGDLRKKDALTFEFHRENFKPNRDLDLLFLRKIDD